MRKSQKQMLMLGGVGALALYIMGKSSAAAAPASNAGGMGEYLGDGYGLSESQMDDQSGLGFPTAGSGYPTGGSGYPTAGAPHIVSGGHPWWRNRYGQHIRDANSSYGWNGMAPWMRNIEYGSPWGGYGYGGGGGGGAYNPGWVPDIMSPYSGYGPSAVEMETPGSIATLASQIDEGAY